MPWAVERNSTYDFVLNIYLYNFDLFPVVYNCMSINDTDYRQIQNGRTSPSEIFGSQIGTHFNVFNLILSFVSGTELYQNLTYIIESEYMIYVRVGRTHGLGHM